MSQQKHNGRSSNPHRIPKRNASTNGKTEGEPPLPPQPPRPTNDNRDDWREYWKAHDQPWRTEPEISKERQEELARRRATPVDIEKGIYPFKGMKLGRADVEWLLATHDRGRGPVQWEDVTQRDRKGLDLRGANLQLIDLTRLPLAKMRGGLSDEEWLRATVEQREQIVN